MAGDPRPATDAHERNKSPSRSASSASKPPKRKSPSAKKTQRAVKDYEDHVKSEMIRRALELHDKRVEELAKNALANAKKSYGECERVATESKVDSIFSKSCSAWLTANSE